MRTTFRGVTVSLESTGSTHVAHATVPTKYGPMRILDLQIPPNDVSWFHSHEWPVLYMTLSTSTTRTQAQGSAGIRFSSAETKAL